MTPGTCENCGRFGPLTNRKSVHGEVDLCPTCRNPRGSAGDAWSDAYADLHHDLVTKLGLRDLDVQHAIDEMDEIADERDAANKLLWEARGYVRGNQGGGYMFPDHATAVADGIRGLRSRIDAHLKENP